MFFKRPLIAIDIGSSSLKIVEMRGGFDKKLHTIGSEHIPRGTIVDGIIQDVATVESTLKQLLKNLKVQTFGRRAAISLGGSSVIIKKVNFPNIDDEDELADLLEVEAEQHFQHDLNDLYYTWHMIPSHSDSTERSVILVGAKKDIVETYISVVKSTGLKIGVVDCDVFAQANMFEYNFDVVQGLIALANIGASTTQVSLIGNGQYLYTRDIPIGAEQYSKVISEAVNVSMDNAESIKIAASEGGRGLQPEIQNIITQVNEQLVSEIQTSVDFFFQNGESPVNFTAVNSIFLAGGGSRTLGLDAALAASLNIPVNIVNPFHKVEIPDRFPMEELLSQSHFYGVAVGLGMRDLGDHL